MTKMESKMTENALVPIEKRQVVFYEDMITAALIEVDDRQEIYVPVRQICDYLGLAFAGQRTRINRDAVLSEAVRIIRIATDDVKGGNPNVLCLPLKYLPGWLFGITVSRVKPELQDKILRYQRESYDVLWEAFQEGRLTSDRSFEDLLKQASNDVAEAYQIAQAIMKLARNQIVLEARLDAHKHTLEDYGRRLETIEADMHQEDRYITESQATQISQAIKAVAIALGKQTNRSEFGAVWGEFYRKFGVSKYRYLPISKFDEALVWLNEFYQDLTGDAPF
jgi:hypothetical protein